MREFPSVKFQDLEEEIEKLYVSEEEVQGGHFVDFHSDESKFATLFFVKSNIAEYPNATATQSLNILRT